MRLPQIRGTRSRITGSVDKNRPSPTPWWQDRAWELAAAAALAAIYLAVLWILPKDVFWHPDEGGKYLQMASIDWDGGVRTSLRYGGEDHDPDLRFYPTRCAGNRVYPEVRDGVLQFQWPIYFPLATRPLYERWGPAALYAIPLVCGWLTALLSATWVRAYGRRLAAGTILLVGLATPVTYYSFAFLEHTLATFLGLLGLWALCRPSRNLIATACGGVALLVAAALRIEMIVFAVAAGLGWLITSVRAAPSTADTPVHPRAGAWLLRREIWLFVGAAIVVAGLSLAFVTPRHWAAMHELPKLLRSTSHKRGFILDSLRYILINSRGVGAGQVTTGAENIALFSVFACLVAPFLGSRWRQVESAMLLVALALLVEVSCVITLLSEAYIARQGLFTVAPFLALAAYTAPRAWRERDAAIGCLAITGLVYLAGAIVLLFTTRIGYSGDYLVGLEGPARYVLIFYPVWGALSVIGLYVFRQSEQPPLVRSGVTLLALMAIAMSATYQVRAIVSLKQTRDTFAHWAQALPTDMPVVTSEWWFAATMAPYFVAHDLYCVPSAAKLGEWVAFAQENRIPTFAFAARVSVESRRNPAAGLPVTVESDREVDGLQLVTLRLINTENVF